MVVYNVFVERGNVAVLQCNIPAKVRDFVEILAWWREEGGERTEIHSGGRYLVTTSGQSWLTLTLACLNICPCHPAPVLTSELQMIVRQKLREE